jgi:hypothetical protein
MKGTEDPAFSVTVGYLECITRKVKSEENITITTTCHDPYPAGTLN